MIQKLRKLYNLHVNETDQEVKKEIVDEFISICNVNPIWFNYRTKEIEYIFDYFLPKVSIDIDLNLESEKR